MRIFDSAQRHEEFALSVPHDTTIGEVIRHYGLHPEEFAVTAFPFTARNAEHVATGLLRTPVFPGMLIELRSLIDPAIVSGR